MQFKIAFPENFKTYAALCKEKNFHIGQLLITEESSPGNDKKIIINFPTKTHWRLPSEYSYIETGLEALKKAIVERSIFSIAIPALGAGNGGLDWDRVKPMIEKNLATVSCEVYVYEPL